eukprot:TRINITY_DN4078_c0_g1_i1.p1 TRINITY_DN4078_c0_g1~~TRINITY_DN4078_c0_g1_i1.p1  ORF type:complete len:377 (+),score=127.80 TRINITY_DN4078_c0_g1_i1:180-1310(+)
MTTAANNNASSNSLFSGITKLGEGYIYGDNQVPVDIHFHKILEWLVDRKKLAKDWRKQHALLLERMRNGANSLPDAKAFSSFKSKPEEITYFDIETILKELEKNGEDVSKNLFGQYNSSQMKEWSDILKKYESTNINLGESANTLLTLANQDLPLLKRNTESARKEMMELERKEVEFKKQIVNLEQRFKQSCNSLGINGNDIRTEILQSVGELDVIFEKIASILKEESFEETIAFYEHFVYLSIEEKSENGFPLLRYVHQYGNTLLRDYENRKENREVEIPKELEAESSITLESSTSSAPQEIDWDSIETIDIQGDSSEINWDMETVTEDMNNISSNFEIVEASESSADKETLLGNGQKRREFVNELMEVNQFKNA